MRTNGNRVTEAICGNTMENPVAEGSNALSMIVHALILSLMAAGLPVQTAPADALPESHMMSEFRTQTYAVRSIPLIAASSSVDLNSARRYGFTLSLSAEPPYAKWGRMAVKETAAKYGADIVDYRYDGRTQLSGGLAEERFRLWLRKDSGEFGVTVRIQINLATDRLVGMRWENG